MSWKGTKKMKKNYLSFGIIYCLAALLIFLAGISFYSKNKIDELNDELNSISLLPYMYMGDPNNSQLKERKPIADNMVLSWDLLSCLDNDVGFYSSMVDTNKGTVLFESQDFCEVRYYGEIETEVIEDSSERYEAKTTQLVPGDLRYLFFEEPLSLTPDEVSDLRNPVNNEVSIKGARCDDRFIYGGTISYKYNTEVKSFDIATPGVVNKVENVPYEEWIVRIDEIEYHSFGGDSAINRKAHKISDEYVDKHLNGEAPSGIDVREGILTSTCTEIYVFDKGHYIATYCFVINPLKQVIRDHLIVYILSFLALVLVEAVIIFAIRKLYLNQKRFELRSEKLTKGIAYDLQGPLAATREYLNVWENMDDDKRPEYSVKIISEVDHMSSLVTRLLELSKVQDGSVKLNREDVDLLLLTKNIKKRNMEAINKKDIDLSIECTDKAEEYLVNADLEMMYIVINNFMTNAIKYCEHTIKIRLSKTAKRVEFSITNDGAKIDKPDLEKVWDVLYTTKKGRKDTEGSSGVGLSVVKSILDAHKARYSCYSGYKGTNFWFSMDACEEEE